MTRIRLQRRPSALPPGPTFSSFLGGDGWTLTDAGVLVETPVGTNLWEPLSPATFDTSYVPHTGTVWQPINASEFQTALNNSARGDIIVLQAGTVYQGNFTLPAKTGTQPINIVSSAFYNGATTKGVGRRVFPTDLAQMATIRTPGNGRCLEAGSDVLASYYRCVWINFDVLSTVTTQQGMVSLAADHTWSDPADVPRNFVFDHCIFNGACSQGTTPPQGSRRGLSAQAREIAVLDSYFYNIGNDGDECQAIAKWKSPGPLIIDNCYLEATTENVLLGGSGVGDAVGAEGAMNPSDITITRCHFKKDLAWLNTPLSIKNLFEIKNADRVKVWGNVLENHWPDAQAGPSLVINNVDGSPWLNAPWNQCRDVSFQFNRVLKASGGPNMIASYCVGVGCVPPTSRLTRLKLSNNIIAGMGYRPQSGGTARITLWQGPMQYVSVEQNTFALEPGHTNANINAFQVYDDANPVTEFPVGHRFRSNIMPFGNFGITKSGFAFREDVIHPAADPTIDFQKNVIHGNASPVGYNTSTNLYETDESAMLYADSTNGDFSLLPGSPAIGAGVGGVDAGAPIATVLTETEHCVDGQWVTTPPLTLTMFTQPADAASGVAFGTQPVVLAAPGVVVTAAIASGTGTLGGSLTATAGSDSLATFQRLYITGTGSHTLTFSATAPWSAATSSSFTVLSAPPAANVAVSEATEYQLWQGHYGAANVICYEIDPAIYASDLTDGLQRLVDYLGAMTFAIVWRCGMQNTTNYVQTLGPWPNPTNWPTLRDALKTNWTSPSDPIHVDFVDRQISEIIVPVRAMCVTAGKPMPRLQLIMGNTVNTLADFKPSAPGGQQGATYANIVLTIFDAMSASYGFVPDEVAVTNEPTLWNYWSAYDEALALRATRDLLTTNGYSPRFVSASAHSEQTALSRFDAVEAADDVGGYGTNFAAAIATGMTYHCYGQDATSRANIAARATDAFPALMTEWAIRSGSAQGSWERTMGEANASAWALLAYLWPSSAAADGDYIYMPGTGTTAFTDVARDTLEYYTHLDQGALRLRCTETHGSVAAAFGWVNPNGKHIVNVRATAAISTLTVSGIPPGTYDMTWTSTTALNTNVGAVVVAPGGVATVGSGIITGAGILSLVRR